MSLRRQRKMTFYYTQTGFGDLALDLIGLATWSKLDPAMHFFLVLNNDRKPPDRVYDMSLFKFEEPRVNLMESHMGGVRTSSGVKVVRASPGCGIHPDRIGQVVGCSTQACRDEFCRNALRLRPSRLVQMSLPDGLDEAIGIHLRKSDKIGEHDPRHGTSLDELEGIVHMLKAYVRDELDQGNRTFFVCSEDGTWRQEFVEWLSSQGGHIVSADGNTLPPALASRRGHGPIVDFFSLARCSKIIQGIGYSTFSIAASLAGGGVPIVNLLCRAVEQPSYLLNWWAPLLNLQMADEACCTRRRDMRDGAFQAHATLRLE